MTRRYVVRISRHGDSTMCDLIVEDAGGGITARYADVRVRTVRQLRDRVIDELIAAGADEITAPGVAL